MNGLSLKRLEALIKRTREGGAEIVNLLKTGSAYYAPAASVVEMVEAITKDQKKILPCAALCEGEYGFDDLVLGVPVKLGSSGAEAIIEYALTAEEKAALEKSAQAVRELCKQVDLIIAKYDIIHNRSDVVPYQIVDLSFHARLLESPHNLA